MTPSAKRPPRKAADASPTPASERDCTQFTADTYAAAALLLAFVRRDLAALVDALDAAEVDR